MSADSDARREALEQLSKKLVDDGMLIEAGWISLRLLAIPLDATALQLSEVRMAFFAGAQHLFASMMSILDPGEEPTDDDLKRMDLINEELKHFAADIEKIVARRNQQQQKSS